MGKHTNVLYRRVAPSKVLESVHDRTFNFIFLDIPRFYNRCILFADPNKAAKYYMNPPTGDSLFLMDEDIYGFDESGYPIPSTPRENYIAYVSLILKNSERILTSDGILAVLEPHLNDSPINYKTELAQRFSSIFCVDIKNTYYKSDVEFSLFFCSKIPDFDFPILMEKLPKNRFKLKDDIDFYRKEPALYTDKYNTNQSFQYEWHDIIPSKNKFWKYSKEKMDELFETGRVLIDHGKPFIKFYREEHPVPIGSYWKNSNQKKDYSEHIDIKSISRMFHMFVKEDSRLLCPFDWDGEFSFMADKAGVKWTSVEVPYASKFCGSHPSIFRNIPKSHYELRTETYTRQKYGREYYQNVEEIDKVAEPLNEWHTNKEDADSVVAEAKFTLNYTYKNEIPFTKEELYILYIKQLKNEKQEQEIQKLKYEKQELEIQKLKYEKQEQDNEIQKLKSEKQEQDNEIQKLKNEKQEQDNEIQKLKNEKQELNNENQELMDELNQFRIYVELIQNSLGEVSIDAAIDRIHELTEHTAQSFNINNCLPEAQDWISPNWDKLEALSKQFIPTGLTLYNQFINDPDADMAAPIIEYCKAFEKELYQKIFYEYILDLQHRNIDLRLEYSEAFIDEKTKVFAEFLCKCLGENRNNPDEWKFEIGKMIYVFDKTLQNPSEPLLLDFKGFLEHILDQDFFNPESQRAFHRHLQAITKLRNDCAHPYLIRDNRAERGRNWIREKLLSILGHYLN